VEALSVTPFAKRAIDRALSALFVSLVRLVDENMNENARARMVERSLTEVKNAIDVIGDRVALVQDDKDLGDEVRQELLQRLDAWIARKEAQGGTHLGYGPKRDGVTVPLLERPGERDWQTFTCLNSMRDVESTSGIILVDAAGANQ
jgi:hypothetical protein